MIVAFFNFYSNEYMSVPNSQSIPLPPTTYTDLSDLSISPALSQKKVTKYNVLSSHHLKSKKVSILPNILEIIYSNAEYLSE